MSAGKFLEDVAAKLKERQDTDAEITRLVTEMLVIDDDPVAATDRLELALYKTAMRRAAGK